MGRFLKSAIEILKQANEPLGPTEIVSRAFDAGLLWSNGLTPSQTMKSKIATDILNFGEQSPFMRACKGKFTLRESSKPLEEYRAERFIKKPLVEDILVIPREQFRKIVPDTGLTKGVKSLKSILLRAEHMDRMTAEKSEDFIQLISFFLVRKKRKFLSYKRTGRLPEKTLKGVYSLGFGGHMTGEDLDPLFIYADPLSAVLPAVRELNEELCLSNYGTPIFKGLMYDDSNPTSRIHVGLVFEVHLITADYEVAERGNFNDVKFESSREILGRLHEFESWSRKLVAS
jgi:predicted NUDIX family phosphoesterase